MAVTSGRSFCTSLQRDKQKLCNQFFSLRKQRIASRPYNKNNGKAYSELFDPKHAKPSIKNQTLGLNATKIKQFNHFDKYSQTQNKVFSARYKSNSKRQNNENKLMEQTSGDKLIKAIQDFYKFCERETKGLILNDAH